MNALTTNRLGRRFGDHDAVVDLDLTISRGSFVVLLGPSGCGKTTTLRMIAGLEEPTSGTIAFGGRVVADGDTGQSVPASKRGIGMVFQSYALWPHMTVAQNVEWPLTVAGWSRAERRARAIEALESLEIADLAGRIPSQLSGGQQQRVAIARTIAPRPEIVLFDEPLSNLDARLRVETRTELGRVHRQSGATTIYVTHDQVEALALASHIAVMKDGRLEQFGTTAELLERPETVFVASFLGSPAAVLLPVAQNAHGVEYEGTRVSNGAPQGNAAHVMFRPDNLLIDAEGILDFDVLESTPQAGRHLVTGTVSTQGRGAERITIVSESPQRAGTSTRLRVPNRADAWFSHEGKRL